jgi:hypothetical protein
VPASKKQFSWLAELYEDEPTYNEIMLERHLSIAWNLAILLMAALCCGSSVDRIMITSESSMTTFRAAVLVRRFSISIAGMGYLLILSNTSPTRKFAQKLTVHMLIAQCLALLITVALSYQSDSAVVFMVTMYIACVLVNVLCTLAQRLVICLLAIFGYIAISTYRCGLGTPMSVVENVSFLTVFLYFMACSLRLQEHLQHVSCCEQRSTAQRVENFKEARVASDRLLSNLLPPHVVDPVRQGVSPIAEHHSNVTIVAMHIKGVTSFSACVSPAELVAVLNSLYSVFDVIIERWELHKVEIHGNSYLISAGCPPPKRQE